MAPSIPASDRKLKGKPLDLKDPKFDVHVRSRSPATRFIAKPIKGDPSDHWMLTLVSAKKTVLTQWEVPERVGTAMYKLIELQDRSQSQANDMKKDGILWGVASYYATVISVFRRHTMSLAQQGSAGVGSVVGSSVSKGKGKADGVTWRAPEDWVPPTLKDCVIRLAGNYHHDNFARSVYLTECKLAGVSAYSEEQYRMYFHMSNVEHGVN